jgi:polyisoprenoid-binding protein YceI
MEQSYTVSPSVDSTVAVEIWKNTVTKKRKHIIYFEGFRGEVRFAPEQTSVSEFRLSIDANSAICCDKRLSPRKRKSATCYARDVALAAAQYPEIQFASDRISTKQLRGFAIEGQLKLRDVSRTVKVNVVLSQVRGDLQIDGDSTFRLSDFGIRPPRRLFGLYSVNDEVLVRLLLWAR